MSRKFFFWWRKIAISARNFIRGKSNCYCLGWKNGTLPDLVHEVEFINGIGNIQKFVAMSADEKDLMKVRHKKDLNRTNSKFL